MNLPGTTTRTFSLKQLKYQNLEHKRMIKLKMLISFYYFISSFILVVGYLPHYISNPSNRVVVIMKRVYHIQQVLFSEVSRCSSAKRQQMVLLCTSPRP